MSEINETTEINRIVNRHMARILTELTDAGCPALFVDAVKSKLQWMRSDLAKATQKEQQYATETTIHPSPFTRR